MATKKKLVEVKDHVLLPKHSVLSEKEKKDLMKKYNLVGRELPVILPDDPAIVGLGVKAGQVVKIERESPTAKKSFFYRIVVSK